MSAEQPSRGKFCAHCGRPPTACGCGKRASLRTLDAWDQEDNAPPKGALNDKPLMKAMPVVAEKVMALPEPRVIADHEHRPIKKRGRPKKESWTKPPEAVKAEPTHFDQDVDPDRHWVAHTEIDIEHAISSIYALSTHLLSVGGSPENPKVIGPHVNVRPIGPNNWEVGVCYNGFSLSHNAETLGKALHETLSDLTTRVAEQAEQANALLESL